MTTGRANSLTSGNEVIEGMDSFEILDWPSTIKESAHHRLALVE